MVMIPRIALVSTVAALFGVAVADLKITNPSGDLWWVAKSQNVLAWTCHDTNITSFTVLIANKDQNVLTAPMAIVPTQNNFDCSITISQNQASQPAAKGYTILLANIVNNTDILATSEEFEIKPLGSVYPTSTTPASTPTGSDATQSGTGAPKPNGGSLFTASYGFGLAALGAVLGLVAV